MQRAFESFWTNRPGPGGIGLQDYYAQGVESVVSRFADNPWVIGYDLMNEPWPGADWQPCAAPPDGCPDLEREYLAPFHHKMGEVIRSVTNEQLVFAEPFVLFNFGQTPTTLPGTEPQIALSFHSYAADVAGEEAVLAFGVEAAVRDGAPALVTEFGASTDADLLNRLTSQMETQILPWLDWAYNESIIADSSQPAGPDNLRSVDAFTALVRPYPTALAGTPTKLSFDLETGEFDLEYRTVAPNGTRLDDDLVTVVSVPARHYPDGYTATAQGATVTSAPCAARLTLLADSAADMVTLRLSPSVEACG
jgi:endoglycosylceramidase